MKQRDVHRRVDRGDRLMRERVHDPYKTRLKLRDPTLCPQCGAVYSKGRWHWAERGWSDTGGVGRAPQLDRLIDGLADAVESWTGVTAPDVR